MGEKEVTPQRSRKDARHPTCRFPAEFARRMFPGHDRGACTGKVPTVHVWLWPKDGGESGMHRILVVDDDEHILRSLDRALTAQGYQVETVATGHLALKSSEENPPDLVITDINMPEMDGIEVILSFQERLPGVRIIAMSGGGQFTTDLLLGNAEMHGAVFSLPKPFELDALLAAVGQALADEPDVPDPEQ